MKRRKYFKIHKIEKNAGVSLAIVMIILVLFTAFSLTLMRGAGAMLAQANKRTEQERCYQLAQSFAQALEEDLFKYNNKKWDSPEVNGTFYKYACNFLNGIYGEYDPAHPELTTYHYSAAITDDATKDTYGTVKIALRKETNADSESDFPTKEDELSEEYILGNKEISEIDKTFTHHLFTVEVTVTLGDVSYSYQTEYTSAEGYKVEYRGKKENGDFILLKYIDASEEFREYTESGDIFGDHNKIYYFYNTDEITKCEFKKVNPE